MFGWKELPDGEKFHIAIVLFPLDEWPDTDSNAQKVDNSLIKFFF